MLIASAGFLVYLGSSLAILAGNSGAVHTQPGTLSMRRVSGGALVICGGGRLPNRVRERFVELAGGSQARIVIIPTAHPVADKADAVGSLLEVWKRNPVASLQLLHTRSRDQANDPAFTRPLAEATGVWIGGGRQDSLTKAYLGTEVERQLKALLARGGVIGGTSAGAAVMSRVMIASGRTEPVLGEGFDLLPGAVIDQHFLKRHRLTRLLNVVRQHPDLVGFGIDEQTALVVDIHNRRLSVIGQSYVVACVPEKSGETFSPHLEILTPGDEADLALLRVRPDDAVIPGFEFDAL